MEKPSAEEPAKPAKEEAPKPIVKEEAAKPSVTSQKIEALIKEANGLSAAFMKRVRAEKDRAKAMELYRNGRPDMKPLLSQILDLAKKEPSSAGSAKGLAWGFQSFAAEDKKIAQDLLMTHHIDSDVMLQIMQGMSRKRNPDLKMIRDIMATSKNEKVRQTGVYTIANAYSRDPSKKEEVLALYKKLEAWPNIDKSNPKLLAYAKQKIFVNENLSIGSVAPDIVGADHEDKEFKLSDYRGKVVMIDFWGIW